MRSTAAGAVADAAAQRSTAAASVSASHCRARHAVDVRGEDGRQRVGGDAADRGRVAARVECGQRRGDGAPRAGDRRQLGREAHGLRQVDQQPEQPFLQRLEAHRELARRERVDTAAALRRVERGRRGRALGARADRVQPRHQRGRLAHRPAAEHAGRRQRPRRADRHLPRDRAVDGKSHDEFTLEVHAACPGTAP